MRKRESLNILQGKFYPTASNLLVKYISDEFAGKYIILLQQNVNQTVLQLIGFLNHLAQHVQNQYYFLSPEHFTQTGQKYMLEKKLKLSLSHLVAFSGRGPLDKKEECPSCSECSAIKLNLVLFSVNTMKISSKFSLQTSVCFVEPFYSRCQFLPFPGKLIRLT